MGFPSDTHFFLVSHEKNQMIKNEASILKNKTDQVENNTCTRHILNTREVIPSPPLPHENPLPPLHPSSIIELC